MGILEDVMFNAKAAVNAVGQKAGQIVDVSKLRLNAADLNNEISKRYESLGRLVYDAKKTENSSSDLVEECIAVIDDLYEQLDEVNDQIALIKNLIKCKSCGYENSQEAVFCSRCGAKLAKEEAPASQEGPVSGQPQETTAPRQSEEPEEKDPNEDQ